MLNTIIKDFDLNELGILNVYPYGSRVYGTAGYQSDYDFIIIMKNKSIEKDYMDSRNNKNITIYQENSFIDLIGRHRIFALECFFLPKEKMLKCDKDFNFKLNLKTLRSSISEKSSQSWVKAKKKFEVEIDRNIYIGKKSLFHSLRIIDFGCQIAEFKTIKNYSSSNYLWNEISSNPSENWNDYYSKYHDLFNSTMTEFRRLAPK